MLSVVPLQEILEIEMQAERPVLVQETRCQVRGLAFHTMGMVVAVPFSRRTTDEAALQREGFGTNSGNQRLQPVGQIHQAHALRGLGTVKGITDGHPA